MGVTINQDNKRIFMYKSVVCKFY